MGTLYRRASFQVGQPGTTRFILITTASPQAVMMATGAQAMYIFNVGTANAYWGADTTVAIGSGAILYAGVGKRFGDDAEDAADSFTIYMTADTAQGAFLAVNDYYL